MKIEKFIEKVGDFLGLEGSKKSGKKKSVKSLLKKLYDRKDKLSKILEKLDKKKEKKKRKEIKEELSIVVIHIEKAEKILKKLTTDDSPAKEEKKG